MRRVAARLIAQRRGVVAYGKPFAGARRKSGLARSLNIACKGTKQQAKEVFTEMFKTGQDAAAIVDAKGLRQNSDTGELEKIVQEVIADPAVAKSIAEYRAGNEKAINALKGPIMKRTQGKANPVLIDQLLRKFLA